MADQDDPSANAVERTRARTGLWVVVLGDATIAAAAVFGVVKFGGAAPIPLSSPQS